MKQTVTLGMILLISSLMISGCGTQTPTPSISENEVVKTTINKELNQKQVHKIIAKTAKADGWKVTEFKDNEILAEKINKEDTTAVSIKFNKLSFKIIPQNSELHNLIFKALNE